MPRALSSRLLRIHQRALISALQLSGGDLGRAARALGVTRDELEVLLSGRTVSDSQVSGTRRRISRPAEVPIADDDDEE